MKNITSIGIENFRVFDKMTTFDLAPITLLTGANNTGKSSFLKILKLLRDNQAKGYFQKLDFTIGDNVKTINNNTHFFNYTNSSNIFKFVICCENSFKTIFEFNLINNNNLRINSIEIENIIDNVKVLSFEFEYGDYDSSTKNKLSSAGFLIDYDFDIRKIKICVPFNEIKKVIFDFENIYDFGKIYNSESMSRWNYIEELQDNRRIQLFNEAIINKILIENLIDTEETKLFLKELESTIIFNFFTKTEISCLNNNISFNEILNLFKTELLDFNNPAFFKPIIYEDQIIETDWRQPKIGTLNYLQLKDKYPIQYEIFKNISLPEIWNMEFENKVIRGYIYKRLVDIIKASIAFDQLFFINIDRTSQQRIFLYDGTSLLHKLLIQFIKKKFHDPQSDSMCFVNDIFKEMDIADECIIKEEVKDFGATIKIKKGENIIDLVDCGFGVTQIFILAISMVLNQGKTLILEEPESNFHPKLQSKLADIIALGQKKYNNHFIIETHSEYLIRKFQFLTAKKELKSTDIVIYYFNSNKDNNENLTKKITINDDGTLSDDFGPGFLDEADNIAMDLYKFQRSNKN